LKPFTLALCVSPARQLSLAASMMLNQLEMLFSQLLATGQALKSFINAP
ncbi:LysR family transcriptional regulator, partial [Klebsiella variicola subsp. variicola]